MRNSLLSVFIFGNLISLAQSNCLVCEVFKKLEIENISIDIKDSLLKNVRYYPIENDSGNVAFYSLLIDSVKQNMRIEFGFESGQSAYSVDEIKLLIDSNDKVVVLYSHFVGSNAFLNQDEIQVYKYDFKNQNITRDVKLEKNFKINVSECFKKSLKKKVKEELNSTLTFTYDLYYSGDWTIKWRIVTFYLSENIMDETLFEGNTIGFSWEQNQFIQSKPFFE